MTQPNAICGATTRAPNAPEQKHWMPDFLGFLSKGESIVKAAGACGIAAGTAYYHRGRDLRFANDWDEAFDLGRAHRKSPDRPHTRSANWKPLFLEALAETSNVSASAARVKTPLRTVYKLRRENPRFAAQWLAALREGYDNLEMELLGYLRNPQAGRKMDVSSALRLLAAHRETVARERRLSEDDDEQAVLDSIDTFIEEMRQRRAANRAILLEAEANDEDQED